MAALTAPRPAFHSQRVPSSELASALLFWNQGSKAMPVLLAGRSHDGEALEQKPILDIPLKFVEERLRASGNDLLGQCVYLNKSITNQAIRFLNIPYVIQCVDYFISCGGR